MLFKTWEWTQIRMTFWQSFSFRPSLMRPTKPMLQMSSLQLICQLTR